MVITDKEEKMHSHTDHTRYTLLKRLLWMVFIWSASVLGLAIVSFGIRAMMTAAGMRV